MKTAQTLRKCIHCGTKAVKPRKGIGRTIHYRTMPCLEIPNDILVPTCGRCKSEFLDEDAVAILIPSLQTAYLQSLRTRIRIAIDILSKHISQRRLERVLQMLKRLRSIVRISISCLLRNSSASKDCCCSSGTGCAVGRSVAANSARISASMRSFLLSLPVARAKPALGPVGLELARELRDRFIGIGHRPRAPPGATASCRCSLATSTPTNLSSDILFLHRKEPRVPLGQTLQTMRVVLWQLLGLIQEAHQRRPLLNNELSQKLAHGEVGLSLLGLLCRLTRCAISPSGVLRNGPHSKED